MKSPIDVKEVQVLNDKLVALTRFISRSVNNFAPFFHMLKNNKTFEWTNIYEEAFKNIKDYLVTLLILTQLEMGEILYLYLDALDKAVSSILIKEEKDNQKPIYIMSQMLQRTKLRYQ